MEVLIYRHTLLWILGKDILDQRELAGWSSLKYQLWPLSQGSAQVVAT